MRVIVTIHNVGTYINAQLSSKHVFQDTEYNGEIKRVPILQRFCIAVFLTCLYKRIAILISPIYYYYYLIGTRLATIIVN